MLAQQQIQPDSVIEKIQQRAESFWIAEVTAIYRAEAGLTQKLELAATYAEYADLFQLETVRQVIGWADQDPTTKHLAAFLAMRFLQKHMADIDEQLFAQMASATIEWEDRKIPFFATSALLANELDATRQSKLYQARNHIVALGNDLRQERWHICQTHLRELGYTSYFQLCNHLQGLHLETLQQTAISILDDTAENYFAELAFWGRKLLGTEKVAAAAVPYLLRGSQFDPLFPAEGLTLALHKTAAGLGIDLNRLSGLEVDLEIRPTKSPRPFCAFIQIPNQIKLVAQPMGGHRDYRAVLHELGHALHGSFTSSTLPFSDRYVGDDSVGECYAFLFENLANTPRWYAYNFGSQLESSYFRFARFIWLLLIRRAAAKVLYECQLHQGIPQPQELYAALLTQHLGIDASSDHYLSDVDDGFHAAQYFRAWILEAQLRETLRDLFGNDWFAQPEAGSYLQQCWRNGQRHSAEDITGWGLKENGRSYEALVAGVG